MPFASVSKQVFVGNHLRESVFRLQGPKMIFMQSNSSLHDGFYTRTRFETEIQGNSAVVFGMVIVNRLEGI